MKVIQNANVSLMSNKCYFVVWMIDSFCLSFCDSETLSSDFQQVKEIIDSPAILSCPYYPLFIHVLTQYIPFTSPSQKEFLVSVLQRQLSVFTCIGIERIEGDVEDAFCVESTVSVGMEANPVGCRVCAKALLHRILPITAVPVFNLIFHKLSNGEYGSD